jgi:hypothetical protein
MVRSCNYHCGVHPDAKTPTREGIDFACGTRNRPWDLDNISNSEERQLIELACRSIVIWESAPNELEVLGKARWIRKYSNPLAHTCMEQVSGFQYPGAA